ncbi:MAG: hypothetical protein DRN81_07110, partial [Thermoproteota archaeon]
NLTSLSSKSVYIYYGNENATAPNYPLVPLTISEGNTGYAIIDNSVYIGWNYTSWGWSNNVELWNDFRIDFDGDGDLTDESDLIRDWAGMGNTRIGGIGRYRRDIEAIGLGQYQGYIQTPVFVQINFSDVWLRVYRNNCWVETINADNLFMFSPTWDYANYGGGIESNLVDGQGNLDGGWNTLYDSPISPSWMSFRDSNSGLLFASTALRIGELYNYTLEGKEYNDFDRRISFNMREVMEFPLDPYDQPLDCRIYWYADSSNNYTEIEKIATILNNQPTITLASDTLVVPDEFSTIQEAVNYANEGDTIFVRNGTYYEHIVVNKTLTLRGESKYSTIIDGSGSAPKRVIDVVANNVEIRGFTIRNSVSDGSAIWINYHVNTTISDNIITDNGDGIRILNSSGNLIEGNIIKNHPYTALGFDWATHNRVYNNIVVNNYIGVGSGTTSSDNMFVGNNISNNHYGFFMRTYNSSFVHNNIIDNTIQVAFYSPGYTNVWDNGCEGNYWSNYNGTDLDGDGVGDEYLPWEGVDYYPLMNPYWNPCDVDHDLKVNMRDVGLACRAFGSEQGDANWNPHVDITGPEPLVPDGKVNMRDIGLICKNFGKTYE